MIISYKEYLERLRVFVTEQTQLETNTPVGMFGTWAYWAKYRKEFDAKLKSEGIVVTDKPE